MIYLNQNLLNVICEKLIGKNIKSILEIGSRDGDDSHYIKNFLSIEDSNVHIVEPNYISFNKIKEKYPKYNVYDFAINSYDGYCSFNNIKDESVIGVSSIKNRHDKFYDSVDSEVLEIKCIKGESLLKLIGDSIDYCQIDVEGLGYEVLESFGSYIKNIKYILIESEHRVVWDEQKTYDDISILLNKTHNLIYSDYKNGNLQSNTLWEIK